MYHQITAQMTNRFDTLIFGTTQIKVCYRYEYKLAGVETNVFPNISIMIGKPLDLHRPLNHDLQVSGLQDHATSLIQES